MDKSQKRELTWAFSVLGIFMVFTIVAWAVIPEKMLYFFHNYYWLLLVVIGVLTPLQIFNYVRAFRRGEL